MKKTQDPKNNGNTKNEGYPHMLNLIDFFYTIMLGKDWDINALNYLWLEGARIANQTPRGYLFY